jgi:putative drug exporter of the RND superfamily
LSAIARWCVRHRLLAILLWLLALGGTAAAAGIAGSAYSNNYAVPGTEAGRATELLAEGFHGQVGDSDTIVWHTDHGTVRAPGVQQRMTQTLNRIDDLRGITSVGAPHISEDGRTAYAELTFRAESDEIPVAQVKAVVHTAKSAQAHGLQVELGGSAIGLTQTTSAHISEIIGVAVAAAVLFLAFGSFAASLLPIATALVSVGTAAAGVELLGHVMMVADFAPMLGMLIGLGVGIDYALFIVTRHRRGLRSGLSVTVAATEAVRTTGRAVVFAGATVCFALLGMLTLRLSFLNGVAISASLTVILTVLASLTMLPALLSFIGPRALSGRERRRLAENGPQPESPAGFAARWSAFVEGHPRLLGSLAAAGILVLTVPTFGLRLGTSDQGNDPAHATTRQAYELLAKGFGPGINGPLTVVARLDGAGDRIAVAQLPTQLRAATGVASVSPITFNKSGDTAVITVVPDSAPQASRTSELVDRLRADVLPKAEGGTSLDLHIGGVTAGYDDFAQVIVGKLPLFVGVVIGLGCLLLLLAFRSVGIALKAAVMNLAAVAAALGVVVAVFQWGWGSELLGLGRAGPIEPFLPVIMVSVLFGLSMDYQVFLVSRMYEEWLETGDNRRAVRVGLAETSQVINSAAVIMISVFLAFVLSGDRVIAMFGIALAAAVALDAFVLRTLLVPALMHLLGGANWWLPGWLDRRLPRISMEPTAAGTHAQIPAQHTTVPEETYVRDIAG